MEHISVVLWAQFTIYWSGLPEWWRRYLGGVFLYFAFLICFYSFSVLEVKFYIYFLWGLLYGAVNGCKVYFLPKFVQLRVGCVSCWLLCIAHYKFEHKIKTMFCNIVYSSLWNNKLLHEDNGVLEHVQPWNRYSHLLYNLRR